ncbi:glycine cleavage system aminomethyltransferase GcvT [Ostreibacterium oceani]|uniref:aminomethyltransferase n=1 Tax=Ostreibacterium oceani TaxID=2654998 RepID=A0A6N7EZH4_9GAMM|nr:glycine cleavage system aminomethyltransferase GcvT [Ostreibacterium oceani]MPV86925.1 glycine cleavage system aminomethyltransferase GcvT [Ostreibacterium oceani]
MPELLTTPLNSLHQQLGAKLVAFAGYEMPVQYPAGILQEHRQTRTSASLFDVSHMGQILLSGEGVDDALEAILPISVKGLKVNRQRYGFFTLDNGGILDDLMLAKVDDNTFYLVINASRQAEDTAHLRQHLAQFTMTPLADYALLALQGPNAVDALGKHIPGVEAMRFMDSQSFDWQGTALRISRSGYTGEDGFEISLPATHAEQFARLLLADEAVEMAGLGARDSLRLEAGLCLYGNDIDESTTPIAAGLQWAIQPVRRAGGERAGGFIGDTVILSEMQHGTAQQLVGLTVSGKAPVRTGGLLVNAQGDTIGRITSGCFAATVDAPIAMGYVDTAFLASQQPIFAALRQKQIPVTLTDLPFVPHRYYRG